MSYQLTQEQIDAYIDAADLELGPACGDPWSVACADALQQSLTKQWRCFHCDELFIDKDAARDHFGRTEYAQPACTIDAAKYREMESYVQRAREEDTDIMRQRAQVQSEHAIALLREEERGYALGIAHICAESKPIVATLVGLARDAFYALDNSEETIRGQDRETVYVVQQRDYENVSRTLDVLDALPDNRPGYTLGPAGKAQWALRNLLGDME